MPQARAAEVLYGSDEHGLVWGYLFAPGRPARELDSTAVAQWLAEPEERTAGTFIWLHFSLSNVGSERWLRQAVRLPEAFYESLRGGIGSTRIEQAGDALVAIIHDVLFDATFDSSDVSTLTLGITRRLMVSARLKPLRSVDHLRAEVRGGQAFRSTAELLAHLLRDQAGVLTEIQRRSTTRVDAIEDTLLSSRIAVSRSELSTLRRNLMRLQRLLAPEPAALFRLLSRPTGWITEQDLQDLRQAAEEFSAAVLDSAALGERVKLLQEELAAHVNEQTGRTVFVLTLVTVLALPINLMAGLFGMNVGGIPLAQHPQGFQIILGITVAVTGVLAYIVVARRRD
jgi:zinc transporter